MVQKNELIKLGIEFAKELSTQLITLSAGIIVLSISLIDIILKLRKGNESVNLIKITWLGYFISIIFGIFYLMISTGHLLDGENIFLGCKLMLVQSLQIVFFLASTLFIIIYGLRSLRKIQLEMKND